METTEKIIAELVRVYETAIATLRSDIASFAADGTLPPAQRRIEHAWCYPELRIHYRGVSTRPDLARAFGRLPREGTFATTVTGVAAAVWFKLPDLGIVIGLAMVCNLIAAGLGGVLVPIVLDKLRYDPAVASGAFVTTITDVIGFFSFLGIASLWFGLH